MGYKCQKCGHERQPTETAPDFECPHCGVIYKKFEALQRAKQLGLESSATGSRAQSSLEQTTLDSSSANDDKPLTRAARHFDIRHGLLIVGGLLLVSVIGWGLFYLNASWKPQIVKTESLFGIDFDVTQSELKEKGYECMQNDYFESHVDCEKGVSGGKQLYDHHVTSATVVFDRESGLVYKIVVDLESQGPNGLALIKNSLDQFHRRKVHIDDKVDDSSRIMHWERSDGSLLRVVYFFKNDYLPARILVVAYQGM